MSKPVLSRRKQNHAFKKGEEEPEESHVIYVRGEDGKMRRTTLYYTHNNTGTFIRNAVTGARMPQRVGSVDEDLYFSMIYLGSQSKTGLLLFFDSPRQCESHMAIVLPDSVKGSKE
jgi:hypothetical protein